ncbi:hypothetical protein HGRIS_009329 [Hohenbuehelia grisea]|uniref:C2H2-type domain-containing protein n=1 Tax=Hohenbuehelia grisea TaxID=104357 RepID=A0ABR3J126_9AGAR
MPRGTINKPFPCPFEGCGKAFARKSDMKRHTNKHLGLKPFVCPQCGKKFPQKGNLTTHIRTHTGEKPFHCDFPGCVRTFSDQSSCARHRAEYHTDDVYVCPVEGCCVRVKRHCIFKAHLRSKHFGNAVEKMDLEEYICGGEKRMDMPIIPPSVRMVARPLERMPSSSPTPSQSPSPQPESLELLYPSPSPEIKPLAPSALLSIEEFASAYTGASLPSLWEPQSVQTFYSYSPTGEIISRPSSSLAMYQPRPEYFSSTSLAVPRQTFGSGSSSPASSCYASAVPSPSTTPPPLYHSTVGSSPPPPYHPAVKMEQPASLLATPQLLSMSLSLPTPDYSVDDKAFVESMTIPAAPMESLDAELGQLFALRL